MKKNLLPALIIIILAACDSSADEQLRLRESFNAGWKFSLGDVEEAQHVNFNDSEWRSLDLPHDWAIEGPFTEEVNYKGGYLPYPGVAWYRKSFQVPPGTKNLMIECDGIMRDSKIWLNGEYIGGWPYGYTSFSIDLTDKIEREKENVIAIRVENQDNSSRWYPGSGIYRNVWLTYTNPIHVSHWGTYISTPVITENLAEVKIEISIENSTSIGAEAEISTAIIDRHGELVAETDAQTVSLEGEGRSEVLQQAKIPDPKLWSVDTPNLYKAVTSIYSEGKLVDTYETSFGVRYFHFDSDKGFFLNGKHLKLKGVNLHHDLGPLGAAVNKRATERQLEIMKEMGVNAIRTAHNPPSPEQLELCDELGILVIDETFDEWSVSKYGVPNAYNIWFEEWAEKDTRALILRDRNHPSIIMWSIGNEIPDLDTEKGKVHAKLLSDICRELDPTRPVNAGVHLTTKFDSELEACFDVFGMNYWQDRYDKMHAAFPNLPLLSTESSATLSTRGEYHFPVKEVYSGYVHDSKQITSYDLVNTGFGALPDVEFELQEAPWMAGEFVWSGFDYHGEPDPYEEGYFPAHSSYFGIVDMCGFKKDRFYLYQSQWTDDPMIHLLPSWNWEGREGEVTPVYIYSNCDKVELLVNGASMGRKQKQEGMYRYRYNDVVYQPGSIRAVGYNMEGEVLAEKEIRTAGPPAKIGLEADRATINSDDRDLVFVTVKILDENGNLCPNATNLVKFSVEGEGDLECVGNGDPTCTESYQESERSAFHGICLLVVRSTQNSGKISVRASSDGMEDSIIEISTEEMANL